MTLAEFVTIDLPLAVVWAVSVFVAAAIGAAIVQRITRDTRRERDNAHAATERSQAAAIQALTEEREANSRRIRELEATVADASRRIGELEGAIKAINENVTGRPAFAELAVFVSRGFDAMEKAQRDHDDRMNERHTALLVSIEALGLNRRKRAR